jgi:hypothetical protein
VTGGSGNDGNISDLPWVSLFDPAMNVRALGEIQARGFRAASDLVDRFVRTTTAQPSAADVHADAGCSADPDSESESAAAMPGAQRLGRAWQQVFGDLLGSVRQNGQVPPGAAATFDLDQGGSSGSVVLQAEVPGRAVGEVWLHNGGSTDLGEVLLRCGQLIAHDGSTIDSTAVRFDPEVVPMPARSSRGVVVTVAFDQNTLPGKFHGTLLASGHDNAWLPIVLIVSSAP